MEEGVSWEPPGVGYEVGRGRRCVLRDGHLRRSKGMTSDRMKRQTEAKGKRRITQKGGEHFGGEGTEKKRKKRGVN